MNINLNHQELTIIRKALATKANTLQELMGIESIKSMRQAMSIELEMVDKLTDKIDFAVHLERAKKG